MDLMKRKQLLYAICDSFVCNKLRDLNASLELQKQALLSETKSSAGDKHETGRAMVQIEMEKIGRQILEFEQMKLSMAKMDVSSSSVIRMGSVVKTSQMQYFIAIAMGKIQIAKDVYYAVSPNSPIGKILLGKKAKDSIFFQGNTMAIHEIF
jgi:transcription elongation GreA/GreB family factor